MARRVRKVTSVMRVSKPCRRNAKTVLLSSHPSVGKQLANLACVVGNENLREYFLIEAFPMEDPLEKGERLRRIRQSRLYPQGGGLAVVVREGPKVHDVW